MGAQWEVTITHHSISIVFVAANFIHAFDFCLCDQLIMVIININFIISLSMLILLLNRRRGPKYNARYYYSLHILDHYLLDTTTPSIF